MFKHLFTLIILITILFSNSSCTRSSRSTDLYVASNVVGFKTLVSGKTYGTGFHLTYKGSTYIITNKHVCEAASTIDGTSNTIRVNNEIKKILLISPTHDICLVEPIESTGLLLSSHSPIPLDPITITGHPRGLPTIISKGHIVGNTTVCLSYAAGPSCMSSTIVSALAYPGSSGSPITNTYGDVVGILFAGSPLYPHHPVIVPLSFLKAELISYELNKKKEGK